MALGTLVLDGTNGAAGATILGTSGNHYASIADNVLVRGANTYVTTDHAGMNVSIDGTLTVTHQGKFQADGPIGVGQGVTVDGGTLVVDTLTALNLDVINSGLVTGNAVTPSVLHALDLELTGSLTVDMSSEIDVSGLGYTAGYTAGDTTTGGATGYSGGSFGGRGGVTYGNADDVHGDYTLPDNSDGWGSGGASYPGGGRMKIRAASMSLDGLVRSSGFGGNHGGGAGGGIRIELTGALSGSGLIAAPGGGSWPSSGYYNDPGSGGGGGGRIAVYAGDFSSFNTDHITAPGSGGQAAGGAGTVYLSHDLSGNVPPAVVRQFKQLNTPAVDGDGNDLQLVMDHTGAGQGITISVGTTEDEMHVVGSYVSPGGDASWTLNIDFRNTGLQFADYVAVTSTATLDLASAIALHTTVNELQNCTAVTATSNGSPILASSPYTDVAKVYIWDFVSQTYDRVLSNDLHDIAWNNKTVILTHGWNDSLLDTNPGQSSVEVTD